MRRGVALLSIAAIVAGTAIVTLPARWMGSEDSTPPAAQMHEDTEGAVRVPASREHPSSASQAAQPASTSSSAAGDTPAR